MNIKKKQALMLLGGVVATGTTEAFATTQADASTVTVQKGDTTWGLAKKNGTTVDQIVKDNNLENNGNLIYVGQTLSINEFTSNNTQVNSTNQPDQATVQSGQLVQSQQQSAAPAANNQTQTTSQQAASSSSYTSNATGNEAAAKAWIASRESGGNYNARNGQYVGKYQLSSSYLGGDYSPAHQEQVADQYVAGRYGSWSNAQSFWQSHGWY